MQKEIPEFFTYRDALMYVISGLQTNDVMLLRAQWHSGLRKSLVGHAEKGGGIDEFTLTALDEYFDDMTAVLSGVVSREIVLGELEDEITRIDQTTEENG